jgi:hypothetical protein
MMGDKEDGHGAEGAMTREQLLTDVEQAADFVKQTQCDALAIAIGTSHGAYKFTKKPTGDILAIERIKEINQRIDEIELAKSDNDKQKRSRTIAITLSVIGAGLSLMVSIISAIIINTLIP